MYSHLKTPNNINENATTHQQQKQQRINTPTTTQKTHQTTKTTTQQQKQERTGILYTVTQYWEAVLFPWCLETYTV